MAEFLPWQANKADAKAGTVWFSSVKKLCMARRVLPPSAGARQQILHEI
jgi:hypothetical protein